jgi:phosphinothricin acetyltransferase
MKNTEINYIDNLPAECWEEFKNLKIEAVTQESSAFSQSLSDVIGCPDSDWIAMLEKNLKKEAVMVFAEYEGKLVGMGSTRLFTKERFKHNASLESLYVTPTYRRKGIAEEIEKNQIDLISKMPGIEVIFGEIFSSQKASLELHKKLGFEVVGVIKDFMKLEGVYYDSVFIQKKIKIL